jgi:hypothetical protein
MEKGKFKKYLEEKEDFSNMVLQPGQVIAKVYVESGNNGGLIGADGKKLNKYDRPYNYFKVYGEDGLSWELASVSDDMFLPPFLGYKATTSIDKAEVPEYGEPMMKMKQFAFMINKHDDSYKFGYFIIPKQLIQIYYNNYEELV